MKGLTPLSLAIAVVTGACAHSPPSPPEVTRLLAPELASHSFCVRLPQGTNAVVRPNGVRLDGYRSPGGRVFYPDTSQLGSPETIRETYDLLAEIGLFAVRDEVLNASVGDYRRIWRHYTPTPAGVAHYQAVASVHSASNWMGLCYGTRTMIGLPSVSALNRVTPCQSTRVATYSYRYEDVPAWVDDPRLAARLPEVVTREAAARPREGSTVLVRRGGQWDVRRGDPLVRIVCVR
jgi:hypothetical protein